MHLAKYRLDDGPPGVGCVQQDQLSPLRLESPYDSLSAILEADNPGELANSLLDSGATSLPISRVQLLAPIDRQEVWAAGVTYTRSKSARMEESDVAAVCYDRVYKSDRPELFMKATPHRVRGPDQPLLLRSDSKWNVPEPELTLVLNSRCVLVGFTVGNDMSSRDIEGANPLYLPQAKVYDACCGLGPVIALPDAMPPRDQMIIQLNVWRGGDAVFTGETSIERMARTFEELISWLGRDNSFPNGAFLMTGTGIVPDNDFTLLDGDVVDIHIAGIGTLSNPIVQNQLSW